MYKKFGAAKLFTGNAMLYNKVLITGETGIVEAIAEAADAGDDVQYADGILCPGFINCHCHLELSHMRGLIPEHTGLVDFVFSVVSQRHFAEAEILKAIETTEEEMLQNGIVAVGDICNTALTALQKSKQHLQYYNFVEASGWLPQVAETRMNRALEVYEKFAQQSVVSSQQTTGYRQLSTINHQTSSIVPHAPYSVSEELWQLLQPHFAEKTVSIHNQETIFEDELFIQGSGDFTRMYQLMKMDTGFFSPSGKSSLQTYFSKLKKAAKVMLVHNTFTKEADVRYVKEQAAANGQELFFCLCVNANLYIEDALPPAAMLLNNDCTLVLGTDSIASNHRLSITDEMRTIKTRFDFVTMEQLLQMATLNGAKALNMSDTLGSFEKGKRPGVLMVSEDLSKVKRWL